MQKRSARRSLNYGRQDGESERTERDDQEQVDSGDSKKNNSTTDSLIADMAQGFIQAQAKATNNEMGPNNKEVMSLLEKVNTQLEEIKRAHIDKNSSTSSLQTAGNQKNSGQSAQDSSSKQQGDSEQSAQGNNKQQADQEMLKNLKTLVSSMLQGNEESKNGTVSPKSESANNSNQSSTNKPQQDTINIQTVSQLLAQSQYELATELENSLQKLKQVISESEKVAAKISNLLGEESKKKS